MLVRALTPLAVIFIVCGARVARAQTLQPSMPYSLERVDLDPDALGGLVVGSGETLPQGSIRFAIAGEYERNPLVFKLTDGTGVNVIHERVDTHASFAIGVLDRLELAAQLRYVPYQSGQSINPYGYANPGSSAVLPPTIVARLGLLRTADGAPLDLALHGSMELPVGTRDSFGTTGKPAWFAFLMASRAWGMFKASLDAGAMLRRETDLGANHEGSELQGRAGIQVGNELVRGELMVRGDVSLVDTDTALELMAAIRFKPHPAFEIFAMGGPGYGVQPGTPAFRVMGGIAWTPAFGEPRPPPPAQLVASRGRVLTDAEIAPPLPPPTPIAKPVEKVIGPCDPGGTHTPLQCPDLDDDGDGILNKIDACPLEKGPLETKGCPPKDTDNDGVPDYLDNCPKEPGPASNQGCPLKQKQLVVIKRDRLEIKDKVYFASGKALLLPRSYPLLDQIAQVIKGHPELPSVFVDGHTDASGNAAQNKALAQARAETVRRYLIKKGVSPSALNARGYGQEKPIDTNTTPEGRANNRRVEFNFAPTAEQTAIPVAPAAAPVYAPEPSAPAPAATTAAAPEKTEVKP